MEKLRRIGNIDVLVDCHESHDIYFDEDTLKNNNFPDELTQIDICQFLSKNEFHPIYLMWEITDKCNFSCPFCYIVGHSNNRLVRFKDIKVNLDELIEQGLLYCLLTGGEALIHPDFSKIYKYLKMKGVIVEVYTNGSMLSQCHFDLFAKYKPYKLEITVYGLSDVVFQANTKSKMEAIGVLGNIEKLHELGVNVICKTPINSMTVKEVDAIKNWCDEKNITHYYSTDISDSYNGVKLIHFSSDYKEKLSYDVKNEVKFISESVMAVNNKAKSCFSCAVGSYGIHINSAFNLLPCSSFNGKMEGYDIRELGMLESLSQLRSYVNAVHKKPIMDCIGCSASVHCKMCPAIGEEVRSGDGIVNYKTNEQYCVNTRQHHHNIEQMVGLQMKTTSSPTG